MTKTQKIVEQIRSSAWKLNEPRYASKDKDKCPLETCKDVHHVSKLFVQYVGCIVEKCDNATTGFCQRVGHTQNTLIHCCLVQNLMLEARGFSLIFSG